MTGAGAYHEAKKKRDVFYKTQTITVLNSWSNTQSSLYIFYYHSILFSSLLRITYVMFLKKVIFRFFLIV